jgi:hypothetical protein
MLGVPDHPLSPAPGATATRNRIASALAVGAIVVVGAIVLSSGGGHSTPTAAPSTKHDPPAGMTLGQLRGLPRSVGHQVYWVGPLPRVTYEVTRFSSGNVLLRYLSPGVAVGASQQNYLTIGSYSVPNAYGQIQRGAKRPGATSTPAPGGGLSVVPPEHPLSTYVAYPGSGVLIEVYAPQSGRSRRVALSQKLQPIA